MWKHHSILLPFSPKYTCQVEIELTRASNSIDAMYRVLDPNQEITPFQISTEMHERVDNLWQDTCFELFLKPENTSRYWEWNLSPSGLWQSYTFSDTRLHQTKIEISPPEWIQFEKLKHSFLLHWSVPLPRELQADPLWGHVTSILKMSDEALEYFAAHHPNAKPDFHDPKNFVKLSP